ncbi:MAG: M23 family metallopeptidase [Candidatus Cloacimonetes bacterium]|nr:M23 family metallopeptidase [Candidatus Cloacimonadota bacterium]
MAVSKRWHITFSTTESSRPVNISLSKKFGTFLCGLTVFFFLLFSGSIYFVVSNQAQIAKANEIFRENLILKDKLVLLSSDIDSIMTKLKLMENWEDKVRSDKNFKAINKEIREMGVGGLPIVDTTFISLNNNLNEDYSLTLNKIIQLRGKIDFDYDTHQELKDLVELKDELYLNTPSIYPAYGRISDSYGWRTHPITSNRNFHNGLDIGNKTGTPIYAVADGKISSIGQQKYFGKYIAVKHKFGYQTNYAHLHKIYVKKGELVKRGQIIAEMGDSGRSTGAHLHFEVLRYAKYRNPFQYLNKLKDDIIITKK